MQNGYLPEKTQSVRPMPDTLMSVRDLSKRLKISVRSVWRLLKVEKLPQPIRIGGSVRWRSEEIEAWLLEGCPSKH